MDETPPLRPRARPPAPADAVTDAVAEALSGGGGAPLRPEARPDGPLSVPTGVAEAATTPGALDLDRLALIGLLHGPEGPSALLRLASGAIVRVAPGEEVAGARVAGIGEDSLRLQRGGEETVLAMPG